MTSWPGVAVFTTVLLSSAVGCGAATRLSSAEQSGLPREQYSLQDLCPEKSDIHGAAGVRLRRERAIELRNLTRAYHEFGPDAIVTTTYTPAHASGVRHEDLALRELVARQLGALRETQCSPAAQHELQRLLDGD
jgi:hypothetical protein